MLCTKLLLKNRNKIPDINGNKPEHYAFLAGRIDIYNQITTSDIKEFNQYISSIREGDTENLNEEIIHKLDNIDLFLSNLNDSLKKGNCSNLKKLIKHYHTNKIMDFVDIPLAAYIGKYGLISYIIELKNMNINMFSEIEGKGLLDFAIESRNKEIILEFFKHIECVSDEYLSKYLTKILFKDPKLFDSTHFYILSQEKFSKNRINFNYLYNK